MQMEKGKRLGERIRKQRKRITMLLLVVAMLVSALPVFGLPVYEEPNADGYETVDVEVPFYVEEENSDDLSVETEWIWTESGEFEPESDEFDWTNIDWADFDNDYAGFEPNYIGIEPALFENQGVVYSRPATGMVGTEILLVVGPGSFPDIHTPGPGPWLRLDAGGVFAGGLHGTQGWPSFISSRRVFIESTPGAWSNGTGALTDFAGQLQGWSFSAPAMTPDIANATVLVTDVLGGFRVWEGGDHLVGTGQFLSTSNGVRTAANRLGAPMPWLITVIRSPGTPPQPTLLSRSQNGTSITLNEIPNPSVGGWTTVYRRRDGADATNAATTGWTEWQISPTFGGLTPNTQHQFQVGFIPPGQPLTSLAHVGPWPTAAQYFRTVPPTPLIAPDPTARTANSFTLPAAGTGNTLVAAPSQFQWEYQWRAQIAGQEAEDNWANVPANRVVTGAPAIHPIEIRRKFQRTAAFNAVDYDSLWSPLRIIEAYSPPIALEAPAAPTIYDQYMGYIILDEITANPAGFSSVEYAIYSINGNVIPAGDREWQTGRDFYSLMGNTYRFVARRVMAEEQDPADFVDTIGPVSPPSISVHGSHRFIQRVGSETPAAWFEPAGPGWGNPLFGAQTGWRQWPWDESFLGTGQGWGWWEVAAAPWGGRAMISGTAVHMTGGGIRGIGTTMYGLPATGPFSYTLRWRPLSASEGANMIVFPYGIPEQLLTIYRPLQLEAPPAPVVESIDRNTNTATLAEIPANPTPHSIVVYAIYSINGEVQNGFVRTDNSTWNNLAWQESRDFVLDPDNTYRFIARRTYASGQNPDDFVGVGNARFPVGPPSAVFEFPPSRIYKVFDIPFGETNFPGWFPLGVAYNYILWNYVGANWTAGNGWALNNWGVGGPATPLLVPGGGEIGFEGRQHPAVTPWPQNDPTVRMGSLRIFARNMNLDTPFLLSTTLYNLNHRVEPYFPPEFPLGVPEFHLTFRRLPAPPTTGAILAERTTNSITLDVDPAIDTDLWIPYFRIYEGNGDWSDWQTNATFSGLTAGEMYDFQVRYYPAGGEVQNGAQITAPFGPVSFRAVPNAPGAAAPAVSSTPGTVTFPAAGHDGTDIVAAPSQFVWQYQWRRVDALNLPDANWANVPDDRIVTGFMAGTEIEVRRRFARDAVGNSGAWNVNYDSDWSADPHTTASTGALPREYIVIDLGINQQLGTVPLAGSSVFDRFAWASGGWGASPLDWTSVNPGAEYLGSQALRWRPLAPEVMTDFVDIQLAIGASAPPRVPVTMFFEGWIALGIFGEWSGILTIENHPLLMDFAATEFPYGFPEFHVTVRRSITLEAPAAPTFSGLDRTTYTLTLNEIPANPSPHSIVVYAIYSINGEVVGDFDRLDPTTWDELAWQTSRDFVMNPENTYRFIARRTYASGQDPDDFVGVGNARFPVGLPSENFEWPPSRVYLVFDVPFGMSGWPVSPLPRPFEGYLLWGIPGVTGGSWNSGWGANVFPSTNGPGQLQFWTTAVDGAFVPHGGTVTWMGAGNEDDPFLAVGEWVDFAPHTDPVRWPFGIPEFHVTVRRLPTPPTTGARLVERTTNSITLGVDPAIDTDLWIPYFRIYEGNGDWSDWQRSATFSGLTAGEMYTFEVRYYPAGGEVQNGAQITAPISADFRAVPLAPSGVSAATNVAHTSITFPAEGYGNTPETAPSQFVWEYQYRVVASGQGAEDDWVAMTAREITSLTAGQTVEVRRRLARDAANPAWNVNYDSAWSAGPHRSVSTLSNHTVTFNLNGGAVGLDDGPIIESIPHGQQIGSANVPTPTHTLYWLEGWQEDGAGPVLDADQVADLTVTEARNFTAVWRGYTVTFASGMFGTGADVVWNNVPRGTVIGVTADFDVIPTIAPVDAADWTFSRWVATNPMNHNVTANVTFTARWAPIITIEVDEDGEVTVTAPPEVDYTIGTDADGNPTVTFPENPDYDLDIDEDDVDLPNDDWDLDINYDDGHTVVTIFPPTGSITYILNGGNDETGPAQEMRAPGMRNLAISPIPTHLQQNSTDVVFIGWSNTRYTTIFAADSAMPTIITEIAVTANQNVNVYAVWGLRTGGSGDEPADIMRRGQIYYDLNGGDAETGPSPNPGYVLAGSNRPLAMTDLRGPTPTHPQELQNGVLTDVVFGGWSLEHIDEILSLTSQRQVTLITTVDVIAGEITTVYAVWSFRTAPVTQPTYHTVLFDMYVGTATERVREGNTPNNVPLVIDIPTQAREGYTFLHWSLTANGTMAVDPRTAVIERPTTFFAVWRHDGDIGSDYVTVAFMRNDRTVTIHQSAVISAGGTVPAAVVPTRAEYQFLYWSLEIAGNKFDMTTAIHEDVTLYAVWERITPMVDAWKVTYNLAFSEIIENVANGGNPANVPAVTRPGYRFVRWNDENGNAVTPANVRITANRTFTAVWRSTEVETFTVTFLPGAQGTLSGITTFTVESGTLRRQNVNIPGVTTHSGWNHIGWTIQNGGNTVLTVAQVLDRQITNDITFVAAYQHQGNGGGGIGVTGGGGGTGGGGSGFVSPPPTPPPHPTIDTHLLYVIGDLYGNFNPDQNITRSEIAAMGARIHFTQIGENAPDFPDIWGYEWFANYLGFTQQRGMLQGHSDGNFAPSDNMTRAEFVAMIARFAGLTPYGAADAFSDVYGHWATGYINILTITRPGTIVGYQDGTFRPDSSITRAEAVTIINRVLGRSVDTSRLTNVQHRSFADAAGHWAYYNVIAASNTHTTMPNGVWTTATQDIWW